jgi:multidrug efflux pump subunit AcrB
VKIFFQPGVDVNLAMAQVTAFGQTLLRFMPPGVQPPLILKYNAATVPILQLAMSSDTLTESQLFDTGNQIVRTQIGTVYGAAIPYPYGGAARQVQIDLKPDALRAQGPFRPARKKSVIPNTTSSSMPALSSLRKSTICRSEGKWAAT